MKRLNLIGKNQEGHKKGTGLQLLVLYHGIRDSAPYDQVAQDGILLAAMNTESKANPDVSVLIPVYNEEENLHELRDELFPILESLDDSFEVVFVDDGSTDRSPQILRQFFEEDPRVRVIRFARNFGQQMALTAGLRHTRGRAVILMDADLQCPVELVPTFLKKLREGYDIVYGQRQKIRAALYRRVGAMFARRLIAKLTGVDVPDSGGGFLVLDERLVRLVNQYDDKARCLSGLFAWLSGGRYTSIPMVRRERKHGQSKYEFHQLLRIVFDLITVWSVRPLQMAFWAGSCVIGLAALLGLRWLYLAARFGAEPGKWTLLAAALMLVGGIQLWAIGILGSYVGRIFGEVRDHPLYLISDIYERDVATPHAPSGPARTGADEQDPGFET